MSTAENYLVEVIQQLSLARTLDDVVEITRHAARELTGADGATFVLRDGENCFYVDEEAIEPLWKGKRFPLKTCISGWSMLNNQVAAIEDIYKDPRIPHAAYRPTFVKSLVMVPIRETQPIGAIGNYWAKMREPTEREIKLLRALANSVSIALENVSATAELKKANALLEKSVRDRDEFLSIAAHELRTPLTTLKMQLQMLDRKFGEDPIGMCMRQTDKFAQLVEQLLDVSRLRLNHLDLQYSQTSLVELVKSAGEQYRERFTLAKCQVEFELPKTDIVGEFDRERINQVLQNLFHNVCRHAPGAPVRIRLSGDAQRAVITVEDRGPGIAKDDQTRIFTRFERLGSADYVSGLGLGLFIAKSIVDGHKGQIRVESEPGKGARFDIELPLKRAG